MTVLHAIWYMFTNNGMHSDLETAIMLAVSTIIACLIMYGLGQKAETETKQQVIADLGYQGYLDLLERVRVARENR